MQRTQPRPNNTEVLTPISQGLNNLFKSLIVLQKQLNPLFSNEVSHFNAIQLEELDNFYHTVSDSNGVLSLQLKNSPQMQAHLKFLHTKVWNKDIIGALTSYVPGIAIGGSSGLALAGLTIEATVAEASAAACVTEGMVEGALIGARVFNPWFIVPSVVLMGTGWFSSYMARQLSFTIICALGLYDEAKNSDDPKLLEAEKILKAELGEGVDGRYKLSRALRYPSTSYDQFEFINLLLAQIHLKRGAVGCYEEFQQVIDSRYASKNIKGMALVGQLDMLSPSSKWTFYKKGTVGLHKETMSVAERMELFAPKAQELSNLHRELIELYFNRIWSAYNCMLDTVANGVCLRSPEEFIEQQSAINKMINFQGVSILRYMGDNGSLAEILLNFIQAVSHVMHDVHNKYMNQDPNTKKTAFAGRDESELAKKQFAVCKNLIDSYNSAGNIRSYSAEQDVLVVIQRYIEQYYQSCDIDSDISTEQSQRVKPPVLYTMASLRASRQLSQTEAEEIAGNALREEDKPSKSLREAKVFFAKIKHNRG